MPIVDDRIVSMQFDNSDFDPNIKKSQKTLEEFEKSLDTKKFEKYADKLNGANFTPIEKSLTALGNSFKAMETVVTGALLNVGMHIENFVASSLKRMTLDPITQGWSAYAEKIGSVQTIMAATRNQFKELADSIERGDDAVRNLTDSMGNAYTAAKLMEDQMGYVNYQLNSLMSFTDETSASYQVMVNNIGKFTSQNIDLSTSVKAMEGIATWANLSGASAEQMSRAMYNISQSLGVGKMLVRDWMSIENANMATVEFKEAAIDAAVALGRLRKDANGVVKTLNGKTTVAVSNFRDTLSEDWFTSDVMLGALSRYGSFAQEILELSKDTGESVHDLLYEAINPMVDGTKTATEAMEELGLKGDETQKILEKLAGSEYDLGRRAFEASYESKTLADAVNYVGDAIKTGWIKSYEYIVGDYKEAKQFWTEVAEVLYSVFVESGETRNQILGLWKAGGGRNDLVEGLKLIKEYIEYIAELSSQVLGEIFPEFKDTETGVVNVAAVLVALTKRFREWTESLKDNEELTTAITSGVRILGHVLRGLVEVGRLLYIFFGPTVEWTKQLFRNLRNLIKPLSDGVEAASGFEQGLEGLRIAFLLLGAAIALPIKLLSNMVKWFKDLGNLTLPELEKRFKQWIRTVWGAFVDFLTIFTTLGSNVIQGFENGLKGGVSGLWTFVKNIFTGFINLVKAILGIHSPSTVFEEVGKNVALGFEKGFGSFSGQIMGVSAGIAAGAEKVSKAYDNKTPENVNKWAEAFEYLGKVFSWIIKIGIYGLAAFIIVKGIMAIVSVLTGLGSLMTGISNFLNSAGSALKTYAENKFKAGIIKSVGQTALMIAGAIGLIIGSMAVIAKMSETLPKGAMENALLIVVDAFGLLLATMSIFMIFFALFTKYSDSMVSNFAASGGVLKKLGIDINATGVRTITVADAMVKFGRTMLLMATSVSFVLGTMIIMSKIMKNNDISTGDLFKLFGLMAAIVGSIQATMLIFMGVNKMLGNESFLPNQITSFTRMLNKTIKALYSLSGAIGFMGLVLAGIHKLSAYQNIDLMEELTIVLGGYIVALASLSAILLGMGSKRIPDTAFANAGKMSALLASAVLMISGAIAVLSALPSDTSWKAIGQAAAIMSGLMVLLPAFGATIKGLEAFDIDNKALAQAAAVIGMASTTLLSFIALTAITKDIDINAVNNLYAILGPMALSIALIAAIVGVLAAAEVPFIAIAKVAAIVGVAMTSFLTIAVSLAILAPILDDLIDGLDRFVGWLWENQRAALEGARVLIPIGSALMVASIFISIAAVNFSIALISLGAGLSVFFGFLTVAAWALNAFAVSFTAAIAGLGLAADTFLLNYLTFKEALKKFKELFTSDLVKPIFMLYYLAGGIWAIGMAGWVAAGGLALLAGAVKLTSLVLEDLKKVLKAIEDVTPLQIQAMKNLAGGIASIGTATMLTGPGVMTLALGFLFVAVAVRVMGDRIEDLNKLIDLLQARLNDLSGIIMTLGLALIVLSVGVAGIAVGLVVIAIATLALVINALLAVGVLALFNLVLGWIKDSNKELYDTIIDILNKAPEFLQLIIDFARDLEPLVKLFATLAELIDIFAKQFVTAFQEIAEDDGFRGVIDLFKELWGIINSIVELISVLVGGIGDLFGEVANWFKKDDTLNEFTAITGEKFAGASRRIGEGVAKGVRESTTVADDSIDYMSRSMSKRFTDFNKIHSPAEYWADLAYWIPAGNAYGIKKGTPLVLAAIDEMNEAMYNSTHKTVEKIYKETQAASNYMFTGTDDNIRGKTIYIEEVAPEKPYEKEPEGFLEAAGNIWDDIKSIWQDVRSGNKTIGQAFSALWNSLKYHGGSFLGGKLDDLKNMFFGEEGIFGDIGKFLQDPMKALGIDDITKMLEGIDLGGESFKGLEESFKGMADNLPDLSSLTSTATSAATRGASTYTFTQNNYSPKSLSRLEIYRQTSRQFNDFRVREVLGS